MLDYDVEAWKVLSAKINRRDGWRCQAACGCTAQLTTHHVIPRIEGGSDDPANLITLCSLCHDEIENTSIRTVDAVRTYDAKWHALSSWWPTEIQKVRHVATGPKGKRKPKQEVVLKPVRREKFPKLTPKKQSTCEHCGRVYRKKRNNPAQRYCSARCYGAAKRAQLSETPESSTMASEGNFRNSPAGRTEA